MKHRTWMAAAALIFSLGCGDDGNNEPTNNGTNAGTNNGTNAGTNSGNPAEDGWMATVEGPDETFMAQGARLTITVEDNLWKFQARNMETNTQLAFNLNVPDGELMAGEFQPLNFDLEIGDPLYECVALVDLRVQITATDPAAGTVSGGVQCTSPDGMDVFEGAITAEFETAGDA